MTTVGMIGHSSRTSAAPRWTPTGIAFNAGSSVGRRWAEPLAASGQLHDRHWAGSHGRRQQRPRAALSGFDGGEGRYLPEAFFDRCELTRKSFSRRVRTAASESPQGASGSDFRVEAERVSGAGRAELRIRFSRRVFGPGSDFSTVPDPRIRIFASIFGAKRFFDRRPFDAKFRAVENAL